MLREALCHPAGLLVQGITGSQGRLETQWMIESGVKIAAGVTPGRGGEVVHGVPVFDTVAEAVSERGPMASMVYAPPSAAGDAAREAAEAGLRLVVVSAERVPVHRFVGAIEAARETGTRIVGPNSQGLVVPGVGRIGCPGGRDPDRRFRAGDVAVVSRSGGMCSELAGLMREWGWGTSQQIHIGGAPLTGTTLAEAVELAQQDPATRRTVVFGEPSGSQEEELADAIERGDLSLPLVALVSGRAADALPSSLPFGHAPRAGHGESSVAGKLDALRASGATVATSLRDLRERLVQMLPDRARAGR